MARTAAGFVLLLAALGCGDSERTDPGALPETWSEPAVVVGPEAIVAATVGAAWDDGNALLAWVAEDPEDGSSRLLWSRLDDDAWSEPEPMAEHEGAIEGLQLARGATRSFLLFCLDAEPKQCSVAAYGEGSMSDAVALPSMGEIDSGPLIATTADGAAVIWADEAQLHFVDFDGGALVDAGTRAVRDGRLHAAARVGGVSLLVVESDDTLLAFERSAAGWSDPTTIWEGPRLHHALQLGCSGGGRAVALWQQERSGASDPMLVARFEDGRWSEPSGVPAGDETDGPRVAIDGAGRIHGAWAAGGSDSLHALAGDGDTWASPTALRELESGAGPDLYGLGLTDAGDGLLLWRERVEGESLWRAELRDGHWGEPVRVVEATEASGDNLEGAQLFMAERGAVIVWRTHAEGSQICDIDYCRPGPSTLSATVGR